MSTDDEEKFADKMTKFKRMFSKAKKNVRGAQERQKKDHDKKLDQQKVRFIINRFNTRDICVRSLSLMDRVGLYLA